MKMMCCLACARAATAEKNKGEIKGKTRLPARAFATLQCSLAIPAIPREDERGQRSTLVLVLVLVLRKREGTFRAE